MKLVPRSAPTRAASAMLAAAALTAAIAGCGAEISGTATRIQPDLAKLDVGNYLTKPRQLGNAKNERQARSREAQRLADFVALPYEADPTYVEDAWPLRSHIVLNRKTLGNLVINDTFDDVAKDLVAGWVNAWSTGGADTDKRRTANISVLMFPDAKTAQEVGPVLEHDDFTYNPDNQPVAITKHPDTYAHWRPGISSIGSWTVHDRYVVFIKVVDDTAAPDLPALVGHVERLLDVQIPLLKEFQPTPAADLLRIPLDPLGVVGRTLPSNPESPNRPEPDSYYSGRGAMTLFLNADSTTLPKLTGAEFEAVSFGDAVVFRSRTARGAGVLWDEWKLSKNLEVDEKLVDPPTGLADNAECRAEYVGTGEDQRLIGHLCMLRVDRYIVQARSKQLPDLHQKISAQYALLTTD
ncbi:DUF7373 family lipoprotein [Nocardia goodfellowii]|uniref:Lipoprotein n=1 Tax=Nocardia goodfellowii TaxID=882446 RepID=A0ABS4Q6P3_9NOCA|nr:hypothetical protein [Nocardia goodfellowii]MBP2187354.1 hypothetical protein [Nocardia goodfellowii]